jgi:hypothetical protein
VAWYDIQPLDQIGKLVIALGSQCSDHLLLSCAALQVFADNPVKITSVAMPKILGPSTFIVMPMTASSKPKSRSFARRQVS